ncbi:MAG: ribokinase [Brevinema sp.]
MKVLVVGSLNIDLFAHVERFPDEGETLIGKSFLQKFGGKGANQAAAILRQDIEVTLWGCVGNDNYGSTFLAEMNRIGVKTVISRSNQSTGIAIIEINSSGKNRIVVIPGANNDFTVEHAKTNLFLLDEHDIIVFQFEIPVEIVEFLAEEAKKRGKIIVLNPAPAIKFNKKLLEHVDYIIPNEHELAIITSMPIITLEQIKKATAELQKSVPCVITTLGDKGIYVLGHQLDQMIPNYKVKVIDTTGAGDSFIGGFVGALAHGEHLEDALHYANKVAAISVTREGAFNIAGTRDESKNFQDAYLTKKNIALICSTGITATTLAQKLETTFQGRYHVSTTSIELINKGIEYDLIFLAPQFSYLKDEISQKSKATIKILPPNLYNIFHIKELSFIINELLED